MSADATVAVIGAGPAGLVAALALARAGASVTLVAPRSSESERAADTRTFAALGGSLDLFRALGVWDDLAPDVAPLTAIRLIDDRGSLLRAPDVLFRASEAGLDQFGVNVSQAALNAGLAKVVDATASITWLDTTATAILPDQDRVDVTFDDGSRHRFSLVAAADGRRSLGRRAADIAVKAWNYPQVAIAGLIDHGRAHDGISTEFHRTTGPLTTVPMPGGPNGHRSSIVWVETPPRAAELTAMGDAAFLTALSVRLQGLLGALTHVGARASFPLSGLEAATMARNRVALVGEAGHVLPPIGAQGLNLGLRDAATLAECVEDAVRAKSDIGGPETLARYARLRSADVSTRTFAVDILNRSLLPAALPFDTARMIGLHAMAASPTLRRLAMRQGLEPVGGRPRLMRSLSAGAP